MMPVTTIDIVYDIPGVNGSARQVLYRGLIAGAGGATIDYGPVNTVDPNYDAQGYINSEVREQMNANLSEMELITLLPAPVLP
jgi:hypothetical protein